MRRFILRRLLVSLLVILTVSVVGFSLLRLSGNLAAVLAGEGATPADIAKVAHEYGLDQPLYLQYVDWVLGLLRGDLGKSLFSGDSVAHLIATRIGVTLTLATFSLVLGLVIAIPLGVVAATRPNSWLDRGALMLAVFGQAIPGFWFGLILIYVFGIMLKWLPISGADNWREFVLPTIALGVSIMPSIMRLTRAGMIEVLSSDYIRAARAAGLAPLSILFKHALRNAILPVVSVAAVQFGLLLGGSVIIESVFAMNGIGLLAYQAIGNADFPVVQAILIFVSVGYVVLTFLAELINARLDPRIRL
ncbi:MAG TPA: ABC transporter permease [Hyphomicrobiales bacterium]|nr:ABC transporter permease [Hyphomicrobiales bacterium]